MSVSDEITRLETAKEDIAEAIENKGVTVPSGTLLSGMATLINSIVVGTTDHTQLSNRDADDQHPISAITDLQDTLDGKEDTISDLATIRTGAAAGATALQSVPAATSSDLGGIKVTLSGTTLYITTT